MPRPAVSLDIHIPGSGSAKAGTNAGGTLASCGFWQARFCALLTSARQEKCVFS